VQSEARTVDRDIDAMEGIVDHRIRAQFSLATGVQIAGVRCLYFWVSGDVGDAASQEDRGEKQYGFFVHRGESLPD